MNGRSDGEEEAICGGERRRGVFNWVRDGEGAKGDGKEMEGGGARGYRYGWGSRVEGSGGVEYGFQALREV